MASYQQDFKNFNNAVGTYSLIMRYRGSSMHTTAAANWDYFNGDNVTIRNVRRMYYSEGVKDRETGKLVGAGFKQNYWAANNRIGYSFFRDMVTQKVDTLFRETPTIETAHAVSPKFIKNFGFAMRVAAERASAQCYAFLFLVGDEVRVFSADSAIAFYDDSTGAIRALIRWWTVPSLTQHEVLYWEVYEDDGVTTYRQLPTVEVVIPKQPYRYKTRVSALRTEVIAQDAGGLPVVEFVNTYDRRSDMTPNIRAKIDVIDLVNSGFANNIEDFADVFMVVKEQAGFHDADYLDYLANFTRTRVAKGDINLQQFQVPTEARTRFVEIMKQELIQDGGVMDMTALLSGNATATALRLARVNLETRVSAFEWTAYEAATKLIEMYQRQNGIAFDFDVRFNKFTLSNESEVIQNANAIWGRVPDDDYYRILQSINIVSRPPEETIQAMQEQQLRRYGAGGGLNG